MRILEIRLQNLNSLVGSWTLDFRAPAFQDNGIFAVTGPTGAGKTTILDAVCLALYGCTPRLGKVSGDNEIMSRGTGECFAEVTFAVGESEYRCHWSQKRAHKQPDGKLQQPRYEVADAHSGKILASKQGEAANLIEEKTGMDFDRFTRSMLLAQGGFAAFLQARPDARAQVLEQITGTGVYSEISMHVHERCQQEKQRLEALQSGQESLVLLSPEELAVLQGEEAKRQAEEQALARRQESTVQAMNWRKTLAKLETELAELNGQEAALQQEQTTFAPDRARLEQAYRAAALEGQVATLTAFRSQQQADEATRKALCAALPEEARTAARQAARFREAVQQRLAARTALDAAVPFLQEARALDGQLTALQQQATEAERAVKAAEKVLIADRAACVQAQAQQQAVQEEVAQARTYLEVHQAEAGLSSSLAGLEERLKALAGRRNELVSHRAASGAARTACRETAVRLVQSQEQEAHRQQEEAKAREALIAAQAVRDELLAGRSVQAIERERELLQDKRELLRTIASLEEHRARLAEGQPCPLCGATSHPYAAGQAPQTDAVEQELAALNRLLKRLRKQDQTVQSCADAEKQAIFARKESAMQCEAAAKEYQLARESRIQAVRDQSAAWQALKRARSSLLEELAPLGVSAFLAEPDNLITLLRERQQNWQTRMQQVAEGEKRLAAQEAEFQRLTALLQVQESALAEKQAHRDAVRQELSVKDLARAQLFAGLAADKEEARLRAALDQAEGEEKQALLARQEAQQVWRSAQEQIRHLTARLNEQGPKLATLESSLHSALVKAGFPDEAALREALLPEEEQAELESRAEQLDRRQTELTAMQQDRTCRLREEQEKNLDPASLAELEARQLEENAARQEVQGQLAALRVRLQDHAQALEKRQAGQEALAHQQAEYARWQQLHELIGSADGKKYRKFAQGLTLDLLIRQANCQLVKMSGRYLLVRDPDEKQELGLAVLDNYQAGEIRSTRNLSGGESFLVSLALALGLSDMASRTVRVDSLFLDEGFGSLDEDSLDVALDTLASLHREGKLIGVISHVAALRERIPTRIRVQKLTGGKSRILGPGCRAA